MFTGIQKHLLPLLMIVISSFVWQSSEAYKLASLSPNVIHINPNIRCPGKNEENIWRFCKHGGYIENPDPKNCDDRYVCYVGLNETCRRGDKCANNGICTVCGVCQKCDSPENCSDFNLCPTSIGYSAFNLFKRLIQKPSIEFSNE